MLFVFIGCYSFRNQTLGFQISSFGVLLFMFEANVSLQTSLVYETIAHRTLKFVYKIFKYNKKYNTINYCCPQSTVE